MFHPERFLHPTFAVKLVFAVKTDSAGAELCAFFFLRGAGRNFIEFSAIFVTKRGKRPITGKKT